MKKYQQPLCTIIGLEHVGLICTSVHHEASSSTVEDWNADVITDEGNLDL